MSDFRSSPPDPTKHVNYLLGMVLGVDEFKQQHAYHAEREDWLARDLGGWGRLWGLEVGARVGEGDEAIAFVGPGVAALPRGRLMRVTPEQCASLDGWLGADAQRKRLAGHDGSSLRVHVRLAYRECPTDQSPVPGEPCRSETDAMQPSRLTDDFSLELSLDVPDEREVRAERDFVRWLKNHVAPTEAAGVGPGLAAFEKAIRDAVVTANPYFPEDFFDDTRPPAPFQISRGEVPDYLRAAFRVWATELRPRWRPNWLGDVHSTSGRLAPQSPPEAEWVRLGTLVVPVSRASVDEPWKADAKNVEPDHDDAPFVVSTRLLQEWLWGGLGVGAPAPAPVPASPYKVVAGGTVTGKEGPVKDGFGGLEVVGVTDGHIELTCHALRSPLGGLPGPFLLKVQPWASVGALVTVSREKDGPKELRLQINEKGAPVPIADLKLDIEIGQYVRDP